MAPYRLLVAVLASTCAASAAVAAPVSAAPSTAIRVTTVPLPVSKGGETEPAVAIDPRNPAHIAVMETDYTGGVVTVPGAGVQVRVAPICELFRSTDGGRHWTQTAFAAMAPNAPYISESNASISYAGGSLHAVAMPNNGRAGRSIYYGRGDFHGPFTVAAIPLSDPTADKPWVASAPDGHTVSVAWDDQPGTDSQVLVRTSSDNGASFGVPQDLSVGDQADLTGGQTIAATPIYTSYGGGSQLVTAWHMVPASTSRGDWIDVVSLKTGATPAVAMRGVTVPLQTGKYPRFANQPQLAEDHHTGRLYLSAGIDSPRGVRAAVTYSDDGGMTWHVPQLVAPRPDSEDQLNAAVAVTPQGTVGVVYQRIVSSKLTTWFASKMGGTWRQIELSATSTTVRPYTSTSSGTVLGDYLTMQAADHLFVTAYPIAVGGVMNLRAAYIHVP